MKLNPDCIRDILFEVESEVTSTKMCIIDPDEIPLRLNKYSVDEITYHTNQAYLSNLILKPEVFYDYSITIPDLTPKGHELLNNIRQDTNWNKTKEISKKVGSTSLDAITKIASGVITTLINQNLSP